MTRTTAMPLFSRNDWRSLLRLLALATTMFVAGCGPMLKQSIPTPQPLPQEEAPQEAPQQMPQQKPQEYQPVAGKGGALFRQAQSARDAGKYGEAEMLLERALRIEPQNPHYWYAMAQAKFGQGKYPQTIQLCLKAESLAGTQMQVAERSRQLLRQAQEKMVAR